MNVWLKRVGYTIGAIIALLLIIVSFVYGKSESRLRHRYVVAPETVSVTNDSLALARGEHLAASIGCVDCHGVGLSGQAVIDSSPLGRIMAPNLTRGVGGVGAALTPGLIERAVRHGVGVDGRPLLIMPSNDFHRMSDADLRAIAGYVQSLEPVDHVLEPNYIPLLSRALLVAGQLPVLAAEDLKDSADAPMTIVAGPTIEYGAYLTTLGGCRYCHGSGFSGGKITGGDPTWIPAANLTRAGALGKWSQAEFVAALRTGKRPDGSTLRAPMPWRTIANMSDDDLDAIWKYLQSVPPREFGLR